MLESTAIRRRAFSDENVVSVAIVPLAFAL